MVYEKGKALVKEATESAGADCISMKRHAE
jgi:hypothetical protein